MSEHVYGLTGSVTFPGGLVCKISNIVLRTGAELIDVSAYGGNGWRDRVACLKDLNGDASGWVQTNAANTNPFDEMGAVGTMTIDFDSANSVEFPAVVGNIQIVGAYDNVTGLTLSFSKAPGAAPDVTWDESSGA